MHLSNEIEVRRKQAGSYDIEFIVQGEISVFYFQNKEVL